MARSERIESPEILKMNSRPSHEFTKGRKKLFPHWVFSEESPKVDVEVSCAFDGLPVWGPKALYEREYVIHACRSRMFISRRMSGSSPRGQTIVHDELRRSRRRMRRLRGVYCRHRCLGLLRRIRLQSSRIFEAEKIKFWNDIRFISTFTGSDDL